MQYYDTVPKAGKYGVFGGQFVPEILIPAIKELEQQYEEIKKDPDFLHELESIRKNYMGRPTPLYYAEHLSKILDCRVYLKREDLVHGGAHKLNNTMGQALLAKKMGKTKLIAETGAGQHGFATAIAGAYFDMPTKVFMGTIDMERQIYNVHRMRMLGAEVVAVSSGSKTLKDAASEGMRYWTSHLEHTHYLIGSVIGPHPFPMIVRDFQSVIGKEIKHQLLQREQKLPDAIVACVGGGSNALGAFYEFIEDEKVELWGVEAAGLGFESGKHCLALAEGSDGYLHGARQYLLQDKDHNISETHSISAGLDYPGVGPELCHLKQLHRLKTAGVSDEEAIEACFTLARLEGIIPALESSHAMGYALKLGKLMDSDDILVINVSGHGGKDIERIIKQRFKAEAYMK